MSSVYTTINPQAPKLKLHYDRLCLTSKETKIRFNYSFDQFENMVNNFLLTIPPAHNGIRAIVNSDGSISFDSRTYQQSKNEYKLVVKNDKKRNSPKIKKYPNNLTLQQLEDVKKLGYDDVLYVCNNLVCETIIANIFFIKNNEMYTPKLSNNILDGTIRSCLIKEYYAIEIDVTLEMLLNADVVFITNSIKIIQIMTQIDNKKLVIDPNKIKYVELLKTQLITS